MVHKKCHSNPVVRSKLHGCHAVTPPIEASLSSIVFPMPSLLNQSRVTRALAAAIVAGALTAAVLAGQPPPERTDLFTSGSGGYAFYRIPGIVVTAKGTVLAYCEARREGRSDWETIDLLLRRSPDGGRTWAAPRKLADVPGPKTKNPVALAQKNTVPTDITYSNPVAIAARDGTVHFLFCLEFSRCFYLRSDDDGATFSAPVEITGAFNTFRRDCDWKVITVGPTHGLELKTGRLVVPVSLSTGTAPGGFLPSVVATIVSDDHGKTWQRGDLAVPNTAEWINPNVPVAAELGDGRIMLNVRTASPAHRRLVTISPDGATLWSPPRFDPALREPICEASLLRLSSADGRTALVFANPDNLSRSEGPETPGTSRDRKNLSIKLSYDDGATWPVNRVLDPGPSAYSDLAALPDGTVLCLYEHGAVGGNLHKPSHLSVARLAPAWFTADAAAADRRP
jgi:sialidase-1